MTAPFEDRWRDAIAAYRAAVTDHERAAGELTRAMDDVGPSGESAIAGEERACQRLFDTRQVVFLLLRERQVKRGD